MDKAFFEGKTVGDVIDDDTEILTEFVEGYDVRAVKIRDIWLQQEGAYTIFSDFMNNLIVCFENSKPKSLFCVYDLMNVKLNGERGLVSAVGHDTHDQYWFDNGEYNSERIR